MSFGRDASRRRQAARAHAKRIRKCPRCGREIRGNAYYSHKEACKRAALTATEGLWKS